MDELLTASLAAHLEAKRKRQTKDVDGAIEALKQSQALRLQALHLDPKRTDPAWNESPHGLATHDAMMAFYKDQGI